MSHKVSTALDDDTWAALDRFREQSGLPSISAALHLLCVRLRDDEQSALGGARQMMLNPWETPINEVSW